MTSASACISPSAADAEIQRLIETISACDRRLDELLGAGVDSVTDRAGQAFLLRRAQESLLRRQTEQQLAVLDALPASVSEFFTLVAAMPLIVWATTPRREAVYLNQHWIDYTGLSLAQSLGSGWIDAIHTEDRERATQAFEGASGEYTCEARLRRADGAYRWWLVRAVALKDEDGAIVKWIGACTDIDDRRLAEMALTRTNQELRRQRAKLQTELDVAQRKRDQDALRKLDVNLEDRVLRRTSELEAARSDAERANHAKAELLATMSHEIRTPMSGLLGLLELLSLDIDEGQRATLAVARESGTSLMRIIDDILDFSEIESNSLELNLVAASVSAVIRNCAQLHARVAEVKNLALRMDVSADISPLLAFDPLRLGQILNNFLDNALKFTREGHVDISVQLLRRHQDTEELRFVVRDTGIGMTAEQIGRLFQPLGQADADTHPQFGGTGLGLVICKRLAELMGGTVEVSSVCGVGTAMSLTLSLEICKNAADSRTNPAGQRAPQDVIAGRRPCPTVQEAEADRTLLLVADDHPTNRMVLVRQAARLGYAAEAVVDGEQALRAWETGRFAAVITDCDMPVMTGYDLASAIRGAEEERAGQRIPIVACTANASPDAVERCLAVGMDDCLVKPVNLSRLGALLDRWIPVARSGPRGPHRDPRAAPIHGRGEGLLDLVLLAEISGQDSLAQAEMLLDFRRTNDRDAARLRGAVADADAAVIAEAAHRIKGSSQMLGATLLAAACVRIESAGATGDAAQLAAAIIEFDAELLRLNEYLDMFPTLKADAR